MNLISESRAVIKQITDFLDVIDNQSFTKPLEIFSNSSIGQHFRHIHGFYDCFFKGIENGVINYDKRERQPTIESDWCCCKDCFTAFDEQLDKINIKQPINVVQGMNAEEEADGIPSSVGRELMYAVDHAIHHLAIIKMGMRTNFPEIEINQDLGVAPSTLEYRKTACVQ